MLIDLAKYIVILFGIFLIWAGLVMLLNPSKARRIIRKAGSTVFINYAEITIRMIPAFGLILTAEISKSPLFFSVLGWFMIATSSVLFFVPRRIHHSYSLRSAEVLNQTLMRCVSPLSVIFGLFVIYSVLN